MMKIEEITVFAEKRTQSEYTAKAKIGTTAILGLGKTKAQAVQNLKELLESQTGQTVDLTFLLH